MSIAGDVFGLVAAIVSLPELLDPAHCSDLCFPSSTLTVVS
jgi:hypothetical protein